MSNEKVHAVHLNKGQLGDAFALLVFPLEFDGHGEPIPGSDRKGKPGRLIELSSKRTVRALYLNGQRLLVAVGADAWLDSPGNLFRFNVPTRSGDVLVVEFTPTIEP